MPWNFDIIVSMVAIKAKEAFKGIVLILSLFLLIKGYAIDASNRYRSPRNPERAIRESTRLIVLHTTEAPARGSLNKLSEMGECHFCVTEEGNIYRIVDRDREAFHAGRSMWNGAEDVDRFSIGIECVGYHNKPMPLVQLYAIRDLVHELMSMYRLSDDKVVCHSNVAYGAPNKWQKKKHRGRKRCGMLFAMPSVRRVLGLKTRVARDPDTAAGRLTVGDSELERVLYGKTDTMIGTYGTARQNKRNPSPTKTIVKAAPPPQNKGTYTPKKKAVAPAKKSSQPDSIAELQKRGWHSAGSISKNMTASKLVGDKWNDENTYYTIRNKVIPGNKINPAKIELGTLVWIRR